MAKTFSEKIDILIFDADDTLWENNIYYIRTTDALFNILQKIGYSIQDMEQRFYNYEHEMVVQLGYGRQVFVKILRKFISEIREFADSDPLQNSFEKIVSDFEAHWEKKPVLFNGVKETLARLNGKYTHYILTKGNYHEQLKKIKLSGLLDYFEDYFIEPEKNRATLHRIIEENNWLPNRVCMIGNSPKSDINPALELGLTAIFIPYPHTWKLDNEDVKVGHPNLHIVECFNDLPHLLLS